MENITTTETPVLEEPVEAPADVPAEKHDEAEHPLVV